MKKLGVEHKIEAGTPDMKGTTTNMDHLLVSTRYPLSANMRYSCNGAVLEKVAHGSKCLQCGSPVEFDREYALTHIAQKEAGKVIIVVRARNFGLQYRT